MKWEKEYRYIRKYEYASTNQHGERYKYLKQNRVSVAVISCDTDNAYDFRQLILLSHTLDVPVRYNFDKQAAYIEAVSNEALGEYI